MGYTIYWETTAKNESEQKMNNDCKRSNIQVITYNLPHEKIKQLFDYCESQLNIPLDVFQCDDEAIIFNGGETKCCEQFNFCKKQMIRANRFCKTRRYPYTDVVKAVLVLIQKANPEHNLCFEDDDSSNFSNDTDYLLSDFNSI